MEQQILDYILEARKHGLTEFEIKQNLLNAGWESQTIEQNFVFAKAQEGKGEPVKEIVKKEPVVTPIINHDSPIKFEPQHKTEPVSTTTVIHAEPTLTKPVEPKRSPVKKVLTFLVVILLVFAAAGAWAFYSYVMQNPDRIWNRFGQGQAGKIFKSHSVITYKAKGNSVLTLEGDSFSNLTDLQNPVDKSDFKFSMARGDNSLSLGFKYILKDQSLYINLSDNPILKELSANLNENKPIDWFKIDLKQLLEYVKENGANQGLPNVNFNTAWQQDWATVKYVTVEKFLGRETINGKTVFHFQNSFNKEALKTFLLKVIDEQAKEKDENTELQKKLLSQLIDKVEIREFETWIGVFDLNLYKVKIVTSAPSYSDLASEDLSADAFDTVPKPSHDASRIADVRLIATALETYANQNGGYPDGSKGKPLDFVPNYLGSFPVSPASEGLCTDYFNEYWYKPAGKKIVKNGKAVYDSYQMTFCLGKGYDNYAVGIGKLTPNGIETGIQCPEANSELCSKPMAQNQAEEAQTKALEALNFDSELTIELNYFDYGKEVEVKTPENTFDILDSLKNMQTKLSGAKTLGQIQKISVAMEMYYNSKSQYPENLADLVPDYLPNAEDVPKSGTGSCTKPEDNFVYKKTSANTFELSFCLTSNVGGYSSGSHKLTQTGVQ